IPKPVWAVGFALEQTLRDATLAVFSFLILKRLQHIFFLLLIFGGSFLFGFEGGAIDSGRVKDAVDKGVKYLKSQQKQDGQWDYEIAGHTVGATAMCILAFIDAGVLRDDLSLVRGVQALRQYSAGENIHDTYPIAIQTVALIRFNEPSDLNKIKHNIKWLIKQQVNNGSEGDGGWQYSSGHYSTFETYYVGLAFYEAEQIGVEIPRDVWDKIRRFWERTQNKDGSWGYRPLTQGSGNAYSCTTNAGIISLILATSFHDSGRFRVEGDRIRCGRWDPHNISDRIDLALTSLDNPLISQQIPATGIWSSKRINPLKIRDMRWVHYNLFAVENVGRFLGRSDIGQCDWYREGTLSLLNQLREHRNYWADSSGETILETSCAVSFLAKGRRPITVSKVCTSHNSSWNQHPYDIDHLLRFASGHWEFPFGWRHLDLTNISEQELIQSPILYFTGDKLPISGSNIERKKIALKLRGYLDRGGFIIAESLRDDKVFESEFRELLRLVFYDSDEELRLLESSHPIWASEKFINEDQRRPIKGISAACRTNVIFIPSTKGQPPLSCLWEVSRVNGRNDLYSPKVRGQVVSGLELGLNILSYALDSERRYRDEVVESNVVSAKSELSSRRGNVFLGILSQGESNAVPRALPNLLRWVGSNLGLLAGTDVDSVGFDSGMFRYPVLFMFGRKAFKLSQEQRTMLKRYLEQGGFLFVNSICSSKLFTDSFIEEMHQIFPDYPLQVIPSDDVLFSDAVGGFKINTVEIRQREQSPNRAAITNLRNEKPELFGISLNGSRGDNCWNVIFSSTDILCPLESQTFSACRTYSPNSALQLTVNCLLYALSN
ncbi:MAG: DUF4159 domain-containing protein, partial [Planctomycetaceae bacterium]|nr:DUF4159 domain-containing protein [Planctomycetaceae bacterium]